MEQVAGIESHAKRKIAEAMMQAPGLFRQETGEILAKEEAVREYLYAYLNQIKYVLYRKKKEGDQNHEQ